ncbi:hypothetical protein MKX01_013373 [Papaver californicum]|nr:hypothetical protein MKX01_013373 [Papaver californicum]
MATGAPTTYSSIFRDVDWCGSVLNTVKIPLLLKTGAVNPASGSAYAEFGYTKVIICMSITFALESFSFIIFGPRESKKAMLYSDTGRLNCNVGYTTFSSTIHGPGADKKEFSSMLHKALEGAIILESDLPVMILYASLAQADAGGSMMYDLVAIVSVSCLGSNLVIDPITEEESCLDGSLLITECLLMDAPWSPTPPPPPSTLDAPFLTSAPRHEQSYCGFLPLW